MKSKKSFISDSFENTYQHPLGQQVDNFQQSKEKHVNKQSCVH